MKVALIVVAAGCATIGALGAAWGTNVSWYGTGCTDEYGVHLEEGDLVQLLRSPDGAIAPPDPATGAPAGNDELACAAGYAFPGDYFEGEDWQEAAGWYLCVRIWNAPAAVSGTYYWDSAPVQAAGMFPLPLDCTGVRTETRKDGLPLRICVNFQPESGSCPGGFVCDRGQLYGGDGYPEYSFGWIGQ